MTIDNIVEGPRVILAPHFVFLGTTDFNLVFKTDYPWQTELKNQLCAIAIESVEGVADAEFKMLWQAEQSPAVALVNSSYHRGVQVAFRRDVVYDPTHPERSPFSEHYVAKRVEYLSERFKLFLIEMEKLFLKTL